MEAKDPPLETIVYYLRREAPEVTLRKQYPPGVNRQKNPEEFLLRVYLGKRFLGWVATDHNIDYSGSPVSLMTSFQNEYEEEVWKRVNDAYFYALAHSILENPGRRP